MSFPDKGIPLRLLEAILHKAIRQRSGDVHWEGGLSPREGGLERVAQDRALKWMPSGEKPNIIKSFIRLFVESSITIA